MKKVKVIKRTINKDDKRMNINGKTRVAPYVRVSTDDEEQLNSYESQMKYYTEMIKSKSEWEFVDMYADEEKTGGKNTYSYSHIKTPISGRMNILYMFDFTYDFGNDGKFRRVGETMDNKQNIEVKIAI